MFKNVRMVISLNLLSHNSSCITYVPLSPILLVDTNVLLDTDYENKSG